MRKALIVLAFCTVFAIPAAANTITVSYSTTGLGPLAFLGDTFSLAGQTGSLTLDTALVTTGSINTASFFSGGSLSNGSQVLTLTYNLTLDGVTQAVSQAATWTVTTSQDTFITVAASAPVLFNTALGSWDVTLNGYSFTAPVAQIGTTQTALTSANFAPVTVPEPSSLTLLIAGLLVLGPLSIKRVRLWA